MLGRLDDGRSNCSLEMDLLFMLFELGRLLTSIVGKHANNLSSGLPVLDGAPIENISGGRFGGDSMSGILKFRSGLLFRKRPRGPFS